MTEDQDKRRSETEAELEREMRQGRKFSPEEAIGRLAGPGAMKGASPVSRLQQAENEIGTWLRRNLRDSGGALQVVLHRHQLTSQLLLDNLDRPLAALARYCQLALASKFQLRELVREADVEWARSMDERPYFESEGSPENPNDPYTVESVRKALKEVVDQLAVTKS